MVALFCIKLLGLAVLVYIFYTQVFVPISRGTPLFPFFRDRSELEQALDKAREKVDNAQLQKKKDELEKKAKEIKK